MEWRKNLVRVFNNLFILLLLASPASWRARQTSAQNQDLELANGEISFSGRRNTMFNAGWDLGEYRITIQTPDGTFPWDWISFVGQRGAVALAGHSEVAETFAFSDADSLLGVQPGDLMRVKAWDQISLAHLTKIGLVVNSEAGTLRAWLGDGEIQTYTLSPEFVGYTAVVLGRMVTVRFSHLVVGPGQVVGVAAVEIDRPEDTHVYFVSDLEPAHDYEQAVEYRKASNTSLGFDAEAQAVWGKSPDGITTYLYAGSPLLSWSAKSLGFDTYLQQDQLDEDILEGESDGRVAIVTAAQAVQYFYIGNAVLESPIRQDPAPALADLRNDRLAVLQGLPVLSSKEMPRFEFVNILSNLFFSYLVNPGGSIYYTDKVFPYSSDVLVPMVHTADMLPKSSLTAYEDYLDLLADWQYTNPSQGSYWWRADASGHLPLPNWYAGNIPDIVFRGPGGGVSERYQYSDLFSTSQYLIAMANYYQVTGNENFVANQEAPIRSALEALKRYNSAYDGEFGEDGHLYPHLVMPMGDLSRIQGVYPAESADVVSAFEHAADILDLLDDRNGADELRQIYAGPMRQEFVDFFWDETAGYLLPRRDQRSESGTGDTYRDLWIHTLQASLRSGMAEAYLPSMLETYTGANFMDEDMNYRWLSEDSENYAEDWTFLDGYVMEGGFFNGMPNVSPAVAYYQMGDGQSGDQVTNQYYLQVWTRMGPYETMRQWESSPPGKYLESSIYIEPVISTLWLIREGLRLSVEDSVVHLAPIFQGEFTLRNLHITNQGKEAVIDYWRDDRGCESLEIVSNEGLSFEAPQTIPCLPTPEPTPTIVDNDTIYLPWVKR